MSILSELDDLILRSVSHPPLTTKGSELTYTEWDTHVTAIYDAIQSIVSGQGVTAYDAGRTYDMFSTDIYDQYAGYDSRIWKASYVGSPSGFSGQTPSESIYWTQVTLAELIPDVLKMVDVATSNFAPYKTTSNLSASGSGTTIQIPLTYTGDISNVIVKEDLGSGEYKLISPTVITGNDGTYDTVTIITGKAYTAAKITVTFE